MKRWRIIIPMKQYYYFFNGHFINNLNMINMNHSCRGRCYVRCDMADVISIDLINQPNNYRPVLIKACFISHYLIIMKIQGS